MYELLITANDGSHYLAHHGIRGMKWGVRRYQNYDGTLTNAGRTRYRTTKWTNIDGSLNERGKLYTAKFVAKEVDKNNRYYDKYIKKYTKLAEKHANDPELKTRFEDMVKSAENSRESVNQNIKNMSLDKIVTIAQERRAKAMKIAGAVGGVAAGVALPFAGVAGFNAAYNFLSGFDPATGLTKMEEIATSDLGRKVESYVNTAIRGYADVNAYVFSVYADEALTRIDKAGLAGHAGSLAGQMSSAYLDSVGGSAARTGTEMVGIMNAARVATKGISNDVVRASNSIDRMASNRTIEAISNTNNAIRTIDAVKRKR